MHTMRASRVARSSPVTVPASGVTHRPRRGRRRLALTFVITAAYAAALVGCDEPPARYPTAPTSPRMSVNAAALAAVLTPDAARAVNGRGEFNLAAPSGAGGSLLSEADARAIALAWLRTYGQFFRSSLEAVRGSAVNYASLEPCPRVFLAASPYVDPPAETPQAIRNYFGPQWLVPFCPRGGGAPVFRVDVSATATEMHVDANGRLLVSQAPGSGSEVFIEAIAPGGAGPLTPEEAAVAVSRATGRRVAGVPELVMPERPYSMHYARWRVPVESPAQVREAKSQALLTTDEVYIGHARRGEPDQFVVPAAGPQPSTRVRRFLPRARGQAMHSRQVTTVEVPARPGRATSYRQVVPTQPGA